jgi:hypothetical protein
MSRVYQLSINKRLEALTRHEVVIIPNKSILARKNGPAIFARKKPILQNFGAHKKVGSISGYR